MNLMEILFFAIFLAGWVRDFSLPTHINPPHFGMPKNGLREKQGGPIRQLDFY